jgi:ATP-dependent helicase/nuclease subunit B
MDDMATNHQAVRSWAAVVQAIAQAMAQRGAHPARTVVLVPFAQLMPIARAAWLAAADRDGLVSGFVPRFESTMNWARGLGALPPTGDDLRMDAAHDVLTAASLMARAGRERQHPDLAARLMEAAWSLARVAAAVAPGQRAGWGAAMAAALDALSQDPVLATEAWLGRIAVAWAASSTYGTDILFTAHVELLVVVEGFQPEPLHTALAALWPDRTVVVRLPQVSATGSVQLHQALDAEDEAQRAASCVLAHLNGCRQPVALVAQDRLLTRRVRAMLADRGVVVRDETGWTLSTTRAAATVMALLRAAAWNASSDAVLEWAKDAPVFGAADMAAFETGLRRAGVAEWHRVRLQGPVPDAIQALRTGLQAARPLAQWLTAIRQALSASGQWSGLLDDVAGQAVVDALRLREGSEAEFAGITRGMGQGAFVAWVGQALESGSFVPPHPARAQVMILPLSQLLGRAPAAVVLPGCDETHLPASPDPADIWTPAQRSVLGLPSRDQLAQASRAAWQHALQSPNLDLLWRQSAGGEHLMPGVWMLELLQHHAIDGPETRTTRVLPTRPSQMPTPQAGLARVRHLSASSYDDLRRCPYRFFALRLLGLQEHDELDTEVDKRDFGNWLHMLLRTFHESLLLLVGPTDADRLRLIDAAADTASADMALTEAEFLPFAATWPQVRSAYLAWLAAHESRGARFEQGEVPLEQALGAVTLVGRIDRIDRLPGGARLVIDYKTESRGKTAARLKEPTEDTQLAFYAALLDDDAPEAMYLSVVESDATKAFEQPDIGHLRDQLVDAIQHDMHRIAQGHPLPALGAGSACDYCAARGLCRQDFWSTSDAGPVATTNA